MRVVIIAMMIAAPLAAQWLDHRGPKPNLAAPAPRTSQRKPDLTGLWGAPIDSAVGNIAARNVGDLKPGDIQPWAQALVKQRSENFGRDNPRYKCLPEGPGYATDGGIKRIVR